MTREEYESRKRVIEAQLAADLELLRAAAQARLSALDELWRASRNREERNPGVETPASAAMQTGVPAVPAKPTEEPVRFIPRANVADVLSLFPKLPEVFDKSDVATLLGYEPARQTVNRAWSELERLGKVEVESYSDGRRPTRYRKVGRE